MPNGDEALRHMGDRSHARRDLRCSEVAEAGGFEPPVPRGTLAFKFRAPPFGETAEFADVQRWRPPQRQEAAEPTRTETQTETPNVIMLWRRRTPFNIEYWCVPGRVESWVGSRPATGGDAVCAPRRRGCVEYVVGPDLSSVTELVGQVDAVPGQECAAGILSSPAGLWVCERPAAHGGEGNLGVHLV